MCKEDSFRRRWSVSRPPANIRDVDKDSTDESTYALTRKVVSHHNMPNDGWVIYQGYVYDVTMFLESHPGGSDILVDRLGTDVTEIMHDGYNGAHVHSSFAVKLLEKFQIGRCIDADGPPAVDGNVDAISGAPLVRWDQPILPQVGLLGDKYHKWIHSFPTTDHSVKMFSNDTVESLTKCSWYVPLLFWLPIIAFESAHYIRLVGSVSQIRYSIACPSFALGVISWLLFEYSLHRWVFHWRSTSYIGNIIHFLIHGHHHITPMDFNRLVFPPLPASILALPFWYGAPRILGVTFGYPWLIGFALGYLIYDMTHFWIHHAVPQNAFFKSQKRRHVHHHYFQPTVNFGISNPLFDYVFATIKEPPQ